MNRNMGIFLSILGGIIAYLSATFPVSHQQTRMDDEPAASCPTIDHAYVSTSERVLFYLGGCTVYGYPSTGGVLVKEASLLDMLFLSLSRTQTSQQRSPTAEEEDQFCKLMRRAGAKWWPSSRDPAEVEIGFRDITEEEAKVLVLGWPVDGVGVWVLRYKNQDELPRDIGRLNFALNMDEKIQMMKEYGAEFVEDVTQVEELS